MAVDYTLEGASGGRSITATVATVATSNFTRSITARSINRGAKVVLSVTHTRHLYCYYYPTTGASATAILLQLKLHSEPFVLNLYYILELEGGGDSRIR